MLKGSILLNTCPTRALPAATGFNLIEIKNLHQPSPSSVLGYI
jgi:hypothetical protein